VRLDVPFDALLLAGPTASGKSAWALRLARDWPIEIVSVDATQVYRGFDVGSAKPPPAVRASLPHHLLDLRDPWEQYTAGDFIRDALAAIADIRSRGRLPVLVGGSMMYFRSLLHGLVELPPLDRALRAAIGAQAAEQGWPALHAELQRVDPAAAARIERTDAQRIERALEVFRATGRPLSAWQAATAPRHGLRLEGWALVPADRERLHRRIAQRFAAMMESGFLAEVATLATTARGAASLRAVGYRQLLAHVEGRMTLAEAVERALAATRQLAKRQLTWINGEPTWRHCDPFTDSALEKWLEALMSTRGHDGPVTL
jgi:tRNA dimethylallyltransferase